MLKKALIIISIISILLFLIYKISYTLNRKSKVKDIISSMPSFQFYNLKNKPFVNDSLAENKYTLLLFYSTTCEHCQYETEQIIKNSSSFSNCNLLFISGQSIKEIQTFDSTYNLSKFSFVKLLRDSLDNSGKLFGINSSPTSFIYNKENVLVSTFKGEVKIEAIINAIK